MLRRCELPSKSHDIASVTCSAATLGRLQFGLSQFDYSAMQCFVN